MQMGDVHGDVLAQHLSDHRAERVRPGHNNKEATNNNSSADRCYTRQKMSGCTSPHGILARLSTASDEIKAAYGSRQSFKTCNGADELAVGTSAS